MLTSGCYGDFIIDKLRAVNQAKAQDRGCIVPGWRQAARLLCLAALPAAMSQAYGFGLGHASVKSALGQPLRAEIEITQMSADEAASLKVGVAPSSAFEERKLTYSPVLGDLTISVEHAGDGRAFLSVTGSRPVQDPFLDLLLRADWASGEMLRDYTLLLDPPDLHAPAVSAAAIAPQTGAQGSMPETAPAASSQGAASQGAASQGVAATRNYRVRKGDTLSSIAKKLGAQDVSLDQMLAAMYRANSGAFIGRNMNLLRTGAILQLPDAAAAQAIAPSEARHEVVAHSADFEAYRRRLAELGASAAAQPQGNARQAQGKIEAEVAEPASSAAQPQARLKLSKAEVGKGDEAANIAAQRQAAAVASKLEAARASVAELTRLAANASAALKAAQAPVASVAHGATAPKLPVVAARPLPKPAASSATRPGVVAVAALPRPPASASASAARPAASPALPGSAARPASRPASRPAASAALASKPVVPKPHLAPKPLPQPDWTDSLLGNPLLVPAGGGIALLLGLLLWMRRRKQAAGHRDSSVFDSRMTSADSFFGGSGGERVDTRNSTLGSSVAYSPSQLDAGDVDPVAEADVYLAYGRDLQAEEILKEALKSHPDRNAARLKLLEIYAKRKDVRSFEMTAAELFALTEGTGADWKKAQDLGRNLDPVNPLYHNTSPPPTSGSPSTIPVPDFAPTGMSALGGGATIPATELLSRLPAEAPQQPSKALQPGAALDLDLNLASPAEAAALPSASADSAPPPAPAAPVQVDAPASVPDVGAALGISPAPEAGASPPALEFDLSGFGARDSQAPAAFEASRTPLDFDLSSLSLDLPHPASEAGPTLTPPDAGPTLEPVEFDAAPAPAPAAAAESATPEGIDTRFELVEEFTAMGDHDMARNLLGEIAAESEGATRARAEKLLAELG
jgi:pilus assembly protein FimV